MADDVSVEMMRLFARLQQSGSPTFVPDLERLWELVVGSPLDESRPLREVANELAVLVTARFGQSSTEHAPVPAAPSPSPEPQAQRVGGYRRVAAWLDAVITTARWWVIAACLLLTADSVPWASMRGLMILVAVVLLLRGVFGDVARWVKRR